MFVRSEGDISHLDLCNPRLQTALVYSDTYEIIATNLSWTDLENACLCLNGFMLSPENQLKVHTLHGPRGEEEQAALRERILKHFWGGHCWFLPGTGFTTHSMGLKALESKGSSSKTWVKRSHLDTKWWGFLCAVNTNGQQKGYTCPTWSEDFTDLYLMHRMCAACFSLG